uniref:Uncharacterized protein n=1 Tax=Heterorhabditis bacteriophora TaxID=37862 RepID=A0A1I7WVZ1_HETBA
MPFTVCLRVIKSLVLITTKQLYLLEMKHEEMENQLGELKCARNIEEVKTKQVVDYLRNNLKKYMDGSSGKSKTIEYAKISPPPLASSETVHEVAQINCNSQKEETDKREYINNVAISSFCKNRLDEILENAINTNKEKEDDRQEQVEENIKNHFSSVLNSEAEHAASNLEKELKGLPQEWRQFSNADTFIHKKVEVGYPLVYNINIINIKWRPVFLVTKCTECSE